MTGATKNQHFVPQSYINRFAKNGKISVYFREDGRLLHNQNPRNYAADRYYYDASRDELEALMQEQVELNPVLQQRIDWNDPQLIEHYFSSSEADAKELFDQIEQDPAVIDVDGSLAKIIIFLHDLAYRNHAYRDDIAKINAATYEAMSAMNLTEKARQCVEDTYGPGQARSQQLSAITGISPVLQTNQRLLGEYDMFFATAEKDARFLISDDPAYAVRLDFPEFCFPLSGKHALLFRKPNITAPIMGTDMPVGNRISISIPNVVRYNLLQFCFSSRYVFGDALNLGQLKLLWEKAQNTNALRSQSEK